MMAIEMMVQGAYTIIEMNLGYNIELGKPFILTLIYVVLFPGLASFICWIKGISLIGVN